MNCTIKQQGREPDDGAQRCLSDLEGKAVMSRIKGLSLTDLGVQERPAKCTRLRLPPSHRLRREGGYRHPAHPGRGQRARLPGTAVRVQQFRYGHLPTEPGGSSGGRGTPDGPSRRGSRRGSSTPTARSVTNKCTGYTTENAGRGNCPMLREQKA